MAAAEKMYCYRHPDRETGVSCSECGRGICPDCMVFAPVGIRCPDHAGVAQGAARVTTGVRRAAYEGTGALVTKTLIALNALVFLANLAQGSSLSRDLGLALREGRAVHQLAVLPRGSRTVSGGACSPPPSCTAASPPGYEHVRALVRGGSGRAGDRTRQVPRALHRLRARGSAGALLFSPACVTVGASGAIFGILGAALVLEFQRSYVLGGQALGLIVVNLVLTFAIPNISVGGHLGGLVGGAISMLALSRFGRTHAIYGRPGLVGVAGLMAVGAGAVLVAYLRVQGLTA